MTNNTSGCNVSQTGGPKHRGTADKRHSIISIFKHLSKPRPFLTTFSSSPRSHLSQMRQIISPVCCSSAPGSSPSWRRNNKMPDPPQLTPFDKTLHRFYSELLANVWGATLSKSGSPREDVLKTDQGWAGPRSMRTRSCNTDKHRSNQS